jgi:hypothetical protein
MKFFALLFLVIGCKTSAKSQTPVKSLDVAPLGEVFSCSGEIAEQGYFSVYATGERGLLFWRNSSGVEVTEEAECVWNQTTKITSCKATTDWSYRFLHLDNNRAEVLLKDAVVGGLSECKEEPVK